MTIHSTAIVHPNAQLAEGVEVQAFSIIGEDVAIGEGTVIGPHCLIEGRTVIGKDNLVFSGAQLGVRSQDLKHVPGLVGRAIIGDRNLIREHFTMSACTMESEDEVDRVTSIGDDCMFMASSHVGHDCHLGNFVIMANCAVLGGHVDVGDRATIGGLSGVHQGCAIGAFTFIGGHSRIVKDAPPYLVFQGNPPRCGGPNTVGLERSGMDGEAQGRIKQMHRIMYRSDLNTSQALDAIESDVEPCAERDLFLGFVRDSTRGILK